MVAASRSYPHENEGIQFSARLRKVSAEVPIGIGVIVMKMEEGLRELTNEIDWSHHKMRMVGTIFVPTILNADSLKPG